MDGIIEIHDLQEKKSNGVVRGVEIDKKKFGTNGEVNLTFESNEPEDVIQCHDDNEVLKENSNIVTEQRKHNIISD